MTLNTRIELRIMVVHFRLNIFYKKVLNNIYYIILKIQRRGVISETEEYMDPENFAK